jgi:hypothetical protein
VAGRARDEVGRRKGVSGAGRVARQRPRRDVRLPPARVDDRAAGGECDDPLGDVDLADDLRLLFSQLEHGHVAQHLGIEVVVELEGTDLRAAHEPVRVEDQPPPTRKLGDRLHREVGAQQRSDVEPANAPVDGARIARRPQVADRVDGHQSRITDVLERERGRVRAAKHVHRHPDRGQARQQGAPVCVPAARHHFAARVEQPQRARRVVRAAADPRRPALDPVDGQIPDDREHGRPFSAFGRCDDASACEEADDRCEREREREARQRRADLRVKRV